MADKQIGERIKRLRIQNNLTQQQLADKLQYKSRSTINKIELGISEIHPTKIRSFAHALNTSPQYLLGQCEEPEACENKVQILLDDGSLVNYSLDNERTDKLLNFIHNLAQGN